MGDVTADGERLVKAWLGAQERLGRLRSQVNGAECDRSNCESDLVKWLMPDDAKLGEKIAVWHGDSLIQVEVIESGPNPKGRVTIRKRGRSISLAA